MKRAFSRSRPWNWHPLQTIAILLVSSLFVALTACGDGGSSTTPPTPTPSSTTVQVNLGGRAGRLDACLFHGYLILEPDDQ